MTKGKPWIDVNYIFRNARSGESVETGFEAVETGNESIEAREKHSNHDICIYIYIYIYADVEFRYNMMVSAL